MSTTAAAAAAAASTSTAAAAATGAGAGGFHAQIMALIGCGTVSWSDVNSFVSFDWLTEKYIREFRFVPGVTALSSSCVFLVVPIYLAVVWGLKWHVKTRGKPYDLNAMVIVHNCILSISSGVLFLALLSELLRMVSVSSVLTVFCDEGGQWNFGRVYFLYYLNYIFKFVELWDTCLLALRGKPTPFLHVYHHAATLILCWSQLYSQSCMQWAVILINLFVHIVMYLYYALHAIGIDVWWKKYLTLTQIIQFVVALAACAGGLGPRLLNHFGYKQFPHCWGSYSGAFFGIGILLSYLILFLKLYHDHYSTKRTALPSTGKKTH